MVDMVDLGIFRDEHSAAIEQRLAGFELHCIPAIAAPGVLGEVLQLRRSHSDAGAQAGVAEVADKS